VDYYLARFWEDLNLLTPDVLEPVPAELQPFIASDPAQWACNWLEFIAGADEDGVEDVDPNAPDHPVVVLRNQADLFGRVASDPTAWRLLSDLDAAVLSRLRAARTQARELAWAQVGEARAGLPGSTAAGVAVPGLVLDLDASLVICHSEKESATPTYKKTFGYHPLFCFLDGTREALSGLLREGRAGSNTTADHITVLDQALLQIPDAHRYGTPILIRSDSAGCTQGFLT
jgi:hypothetical protein